MVQHPVLGAEQYTHLVIRQHTMGMHIWPVFDLEGLAGVGSQLPFTNTPAKELGHPLRIRAWACGARVIPLRGE